MVFCRSHVSILLPPFIFLIFFTFHSGASSHLQPLKKIPISGELDGAREGLVAWRRIVAEQISQAPLASNSSSYVLAAKRTHRQDPVDNFKRYTGGWNISNQHYWASVGFTAVPLFVIALIWFVLFGLILFLICCLYCCCSRRKYGYSRTAYALSVIFLILFTIAAIIGCIVLYTGQGKFHGSTSTTLDYVVGQANLTVANLKNFSSDLAAAKRAGVDQVFLPADVQARIDSIQTRLNGSANELATRTEDNSKSIRALLDSVRLYLIIVAAVMLLLAFLGFLFSILGLQFLVNLFVLLGWFLVAGTFILCGVFLLLHNVVADTCVAMDEWVSHPQEHTALDDILPCMDVKTANQSLYQSKEVTFQLANVVNQVIANVSNMNFPPSLRPLYYNQSGPLMPLLCNPFNSGLTNQACVAGEVDFNNATQVWKNYVCEASSGICTTVGRVTPDIYNQMTTAVNLSYSIYRYSPFLVELEDCTFVRTTFAHISSNNCPGLQQFSKWIYIGLVMVSAAVMLSLIFWVIYARERRHRKFTKEVDQRAGHDHFQHKGP